MKPRLRQPMMLRAASREFRVPYQRLRRAAMRGHVRVEHLDDWYWFIDRESTRRFAASSRRRPGTRQSR